MIAMHVHRQLWLIILLLGIREKVNTGELFSLLWEVWKTSIILTVSVHLENVPFKIQWVISSVPVRICSTRESYPQYPWVISSVPMSHILSTHESYPQYPWGYAAPMSKFIWMKNEWSFPHGYCISSQVLHTLTGTDDMTHGYCTSSRVLRIWLTGTEDMTHGYWWYDSRVMHILTGTAYSLCRVGNESCLQVLQAIKIRENQTLNVKLGLVST